jgi:hypothetical protein
MVRQVARRLLSGGMLVAATSLLCAAFPVTALSVAGVEIAGAGRAYAAGPNGISISGPGLDEALVVRAKERPEHFAALLSEVNWLASRPGQNRGPEASKLGAKYVLTVFNGSKATHRYDLYPLAEGGPRVFRPASQPDRHPTTAAWFHGRLSMPDTLRDAGAPVGTVASVDTGGIGGGAAADRAFDPNADLSTMLTEWRRFLLLNGAVVVVIAMGLAGTSLLVRHRVDRLYRRAAAAEQGRTPERRR